MTSSWSLILKLFWGVFGDNGGIVNSRKKVRQNEKKTKSEIRRKRMKLNKRRREIRYDKEK